MIRVLVCGGRHYHDSVTVGAWLGGIHKDRGIAVIIEGGATGADRLGRYFGEFAGIPSETYEAAWTDLSHPDAVIRRRRDGTRYDAKAGHRRNTRMLVEGRPDLVVAFPGGDGTADMVRQARAAGVEVLEAPTVVAPNAARSVSPRGRLV